MPRKLKKNRLKKKSVGRKQKLGNRKSSSRGRKQKQSFFKRGVTYLFLGLSSVILLSLISYYFVLPSVLLNETEIKNILIVSDSLDEQNNYISLAHLSYGWNDSPIIFVDGNQAVDVGKGYGEYSLNSIYQLLKIDKKSDQEIKSIFSKILNITVDEIIVTDGIGKDDLEAKKLKKIFAKSIINKLNSSIEDKINLLKLHFLVDSMEIFEFDHLSEIKNIYHKLSTLEEETYKNCSVSVVNTTSENGLARKVSEIIENTGAQVVQVEGSDLVIEKTTIYYSVDKLECRQLVDRILGIFPTEVPLKFSSELPSTQQFRSSVIIMIGKDY